MATRSLGVAVIFVSSFRLVSAACTPSEFHLCMSFDVHASETGYFKFEGSEDPSPNLELKIGSTYTFDQTDETNWYHPVGFAFFPDGAHGATWGGDEQDEVEDPYLQYKINGANPTGECAQGGNAPFGLDCYEPEFFFPREAWMSKNYTAELTITQDLVNASYGGVIYYFCHIHSKMSGKITIVNSDGTALNVSELPHPTENTLYSVSSLDSFDAVCGTYGASAYSEDGGLACSSNYLPGTLDTQFEQCLQAIDCQMNTEMRVLGFDDHADPIVTFAQQMIPHHLNAVNMAKLLLKLAPTQVAAEDDWSDILWDIVNVQNYQVHQFRAYLGTHDGYLAVDDDSGSNLTATSIGEHCNSTPSENVNLTITPGSASDGVTSDVAGCTATATNICVKVNLMAGESGYYEFAGYSGPSPEITVKVGDTITFDQRDHTNWYHPLGFAYYPDGAHGAMWGGAEQAEVEGAGELLYKIDDNVTTCPEAGDTGLDCYEPDFFYPRAVWMEKKYKVELTITQAVADMSHGGVIYYFCHIHSKMSGKIIIQNANGSTPVTKADGSPLDHPTELDLYSPTMLGGVDMACGTTDLEEYAGGGSNVCSEIFLCGALDTIFEKCMQAIDCKMFSDMKSQTTADEVDMLAVFAQQMIPHHLNAVNMAKILLTLVNSSTLDAAMDENGFTDILYGIINTQNFQVHAFRNYLGSNGFYDDPTATATTAAATTGDPDASITASTTTIAITDDTTTIAITDDPNATTMSAEGDNDHSVSRAIGKAGVLLVLRLPMLVFLAWSFP